MAEEEKLIFLPFSSIALIILYVTLSNFCLVSHPVLCYRIYTNFRKKSLASNVNSGIRNLLHNLRTLCNFS